MGKSFKKNPVKKIHGSQKETYHKSIRNRTKTIMRSLPIEEIDENLPDARVILNDYAYKEFSARDEEDEKFKSK